MLLLVIYHATRPHVTALGRVPDAPRSARSTGIPTMSGFRGLLVPRMEAPLFYANAEASRDRIKLLVGASEPTPRAVILELGANDSIDVSSTDMLHRADPRSTRGRR